jgi:hypothetical protein
MQPTHWHRTTTVRHEIRDNPSVVSPFFFIAALHCSYVDQFRHFGHVSVFNVRRRHPVVVFLVFLWWFRAIAQATIVFFPSFPSFSDFNGLFAVAVDGRITT